MTTCMWQLERGKPYYEIQTEDPAIKNKLKRRKNYSMLSTRGVNCNLWKFSAYFKRPDIAKKIFGGIIGGEIYYNVSS